METRNILDWQGNVIGTMEMPTGTSEEVWAARLAPFAVEPENKLMPITPRQLRLALLMRGITSDDVISAINSALPSPDKEAALIEWDYSIEFDRYHPSIDGISQILGFDSETTDLIWEEAGNL